jgi:hypothetical protein
VGQIANSPPKLLKEVSLLFFGHFFRCVENRWTNDVALREQPLLAGIVEESGAAGEKGEEARFDLVL